MQAARLMIQHDIGRLPVVENGRVIGIVTRSDTLDHPSDILFLKHRVAEIEGVISIEIQAKFFA